MAMQSFRRHGAILPAEVVHVARPLEEVVREMSDIKRRDGFAVSRLDGPPWHRSVEPGHAQYIRDMPLDVRPAGLWLHCKAETGNGADDHVCGAVVFPRGCQGPRREKGGRTERGTHAGSLMGWLDEVMATVVYVAEDLAVPTTVSADLGFSFQDMTPLAQTVGFEGRIEKRQGRKLHVVARLFDTADPERVFVVCRGLFIKAKAQL